ncbi:ABC transporter ATP-binding protein [Consotaella aegiceratis]|uniref:ABC transporter ATP-binding protein n=1 Tax=Consotaella aegiceratis TaxID=3097961 RepID=UPI002F40B268
MLEVEAIDAFYGEAHILHSLSLHLGPGEVLALVGRNGAGKSTTLKAIMGLVPPRRGRIVFEGKPITGLPPHRIARLGIGYVPEDRRVFRDLTVAENLEVGRRPPADGRRAWTPDRLFELFPNLAERRRHRGAEMSGGEQQMLSIARTLMGNPRCLLLDEPSEGIAPVIVEDLARAIVELKGEGLSILLSEQNLAFAAAIADCAAVIEKGEIRYEGAFSAFMADPTIRERYLAV